MHVFNKINYPRDDCKIMDLDSLMVTGHVSDLNLILFLLYIWS
jgi:hypothetical protein